MPELTWLSCIFVYLLLRWSSSPPSSILPLKDPSTGSVPNFENFKLSRKPPPPRVACVLRQPLQFGGGGAGFTTKLIRVRRQRRKLPPWPRTHFWRFAAPLAILISSHSSLLWWAPSQIQLKWQIVCTSLQAQHLCRWLARSVFFNFARAAYYLQFCKSRSTKIWSLSLHISSLNFFRPNMLMGSDRAARGPGWIIRSAFSCFFSRIIAFFNIFPHFPAEQGYRTTRNRVISSSDGNIIQ